MYIGQPAFFMCLGRQTLFTLCFTVCISRVTVRSFQIVRVFNMARRLPRAYGYWVRYHGPCVFVASFTVLKMVIVAGNVLAATAEPAARPNPDDPKIAVLACNYHNVLLFDTSLDPLLSVAGFGFAYVGKELPTTHNEAKFFTFHMTFYFTSSISLRTFMSVYEGVLVTILHLVVAVLNLLGALTPGLLRPQVLRGPLLPGSQHARLLQQHDSGLHHGEGLALPPGCPGGQRARSWEMETRGGAGGGGDSFSPCWEQGHHPALLSDLASPSRFSAPWPFLPTHWWMPKNTLSLQPFGLPGTATHARERSRGDLPMGLQDRDGAKQPTVAIWWSQRVSAGSGSGQPCWKAGLGLVLGDICPASFTPCPRVCASPPRLPRPPAWDPAWDPASLSHGCA